jgi:O-antigen/teichoic acid export membrane protein
MATLVLTARLLGPEGRGVIAAVISWVGLFGTFAHLSLGQVALHRAAQSEGNPWFSKTFGALLLLAVALTVLSSSVAVYLYWATHGSLYGHLPVILLALGFSMLPLQIWEQYGSSLLMAVNELRVYNKAQIAGRTVGLIAVYAFVGFLGWGVAGAIGANLLGQLVVSLTGIIILWRLAGKTWRVDRGEVFSLLRDGAKLHVNAIGNTLLTQANILMVNFYCSKAEVGWFQFSNQLVGIMLIVPQAASMVLYARMSQKGPDQVWPEQKRLGLQLLGLIILLSASAYLVAPWMIPAVVGEKFQESVPVFRLLLFALLGMTMSTLMANQWIGRGLFLQASGLTLLGGITNTALNYILIPRNGMMGAVWATVITYSAIGVTTNLLMAIWCDRRSKIAVLA